MDFGHLANFKIQLLNKNIAHIVTLNIRNFVMNVLKHIPTGRPFKTLRMDRVFLLKTEILLRIRPCLSAPGSGSDALGGWKLGCFIVG